MSYFFQSVQSIDLCSAFCVDIQTTLSEKKHKEQHREQQTMYNAISKQNLFDIHNNKSLSFFLFLRLLQQNTY